MPLLANNYITAQAPGAGHVQFKGTTDPTATPKALYVAGQTNSGTVGSKIYSPMAVNNGATAHLVTLTVNNSGGTELARLNAVTVAVNAGNNGTALAVSLFSVVNWGGPIDDNGNPFWFLNNGETLSAQYTTAQATTETLSLMCLAQDYAGSLP